MEIEHNFGGGVYAKSCSFKRGEFQQQHVHSFDHLSAVASGFFCLTAEGEDSRELGPGDVVTIRAGVAHGVLARTAGIWLCIHRTDETDPALIDESLIQPTEAPHAPHPEN